MDVFVSKALKTMIAIGFGLVIAFSYVFADKTVCPTSVPNYIIMLVSAVLVLVLAIVCGGRLELDIDRRLNCVVLFFILFGLQAFLCLNISFRTSWDPQALQYSAYFAAIQDRDGMAEMASYLSIYPNNLLLVWIYSLFFYWNEVVLHITGDTLNLIQFMQCALSAFASVLTYKCAKMLLKNERLARIALLLYILITGITGWLVIPYSDSTGLVFPILLLYLILKYQSSEKSVLKTIIAFVIGFLTYLSYQIKPELVIVVIAFLIVWLIGKPNISDIIKTIVAFLLGAILSAVLITYAIGTMGYELDAEAELGWQHFIMQGVNIDSNGGNSDSDLELSKSFPTKAKRNSMNLQITKERIDELGFSGLVRLWGIKIYRFFSSGTFGWGGIGKAFYHETYEGRLGFISNVLKKIFYENEAFDDGISFYPIYALIKQIMWNMVIVLSLFSAFSKTNFEEDQKIIILTAIGCLVFFALLESHPRYALVQSPILFILAVMGYRNLVRIVRRTR